MIGIVANIDAWNVKREKNIKCSQINYEEWENSVPDEITNDSLWKMEAYRLGLFAADVGWGTT